MPRSATYSSPGSIGVMQPGPQQGRYLRSSEAQTMMKRAGFDFTDRNSAFESLFIPLWTRARRIGSRPARLGKNRPR